MNKAFAISFLLIVAIGSCFDMPSAKAGEIKTGIATFYSASSNGKQRDDGGVFNNGEYIIGHKTLPLNTRVRIRNLDNKKEMFVTIDDNSEPGKQDADFVFSKALFVKFYQNDSNTLYQGTMPIEFEVIEPTQLPLPPPTVQVPKNETGENTFVGRTDHIDKAFPSTASFYSVTVNGKKLESGIALNNDKIVVGHKVLPVGTDVKIKNSITGIETTATIQDNKIRGKEDSEFIFSKKLFVKLFGGDEDSLYKLTMPIEYTILKYPESIQVIDAEKKIEELHEQGVSQSRQIRRRLAELQTEFENNPSDELETEIEKLKKQGSVLRRVSRSELKIFKSQHAAFQSGIASYYSDIFNGRGTASGAKFSNNELTAAHRTLPFDTEIIVRNKNNGKTVKVIINDRGPYSDTTNRIIDLSKAAFETIAPLSNGLVPVELLYDQ
jgi:rare lipoprotein A